MPSSRIVAHRTVAAFLDRLDDDEITALLAGGVPLGTGIGGQVLRVEMGGRTVFVKRIRMSDAELRPGRRQSTADPFGLPPACHYGIGSPGFGGWRELAVQVMTTRWALSGRFAGFPLLHHWRLLPDEPRPLPPELADVERTVAYWGGGRGVRERLEGLRAATTALTLFLEYVPDTLHGWLGARLRISDAAADAACALVDRELSALTSFLRERRLLHFDAHFHNILTDGRRLCLTDYGLAVSARFRLGHGERDFLAVHQDYDHAYTRSYLVKWLVTDLYGYVGEEREAFVRACAEGLRPQGIPGGAAALLRRHAPVAVVMEEFQHRLVEESRSTPFPAREVRRALGRGALSRPEPRPPGTGRRRAPGPSAPSAAARSGPAAEGPPPPPR